MINKVSMYEDKLKRKEEDVNRLVEENNNYETISKSHKEINGKLQTRVSELEEDNKKLSKQIEDKDKHIKQLIDVMSFEHKENSQAHSLINSKYKTEYKDKNLEYLILSKK